MARLMTIVSLLMGMAAALPAAQAYPAAYATPVARRAYATPVRYATPRAYATPVRYTAPRAYATPTVVAVYPPVPGAPVTPQAGAVAPAAITRATAGLTPVPGRYKTWVPTPKPTPVAAAADKPKRRVVSYKNLEKPIWAAVVKGGFTLPTGEMGKHLEAQAGGGLEGQVTALSDLTIGFGYTYAAFKYKDEEAALGANSNQTHQSFVLRAMYRILPYDAINLSLAGGFGYWLINAATIDKVDYAGKANVKYLNNSGFGLVVGGVLDYSFNEHYGLVVDVSYNNVSVNGGAGDNPAYGMFCVGGKYIF